MENPPFWWYLPGKIGIFMGYVSFRKGSYPTNHGLDLPTKNGFNPLFLEGFFWISSTVWFTFQGLIRISWWESYAWWKKSHSQPPGMVLKPVVNNGIFTISTGDRRISEPSTVSTLKAFRRTKTKGLTDVYEPHCPLIGGLEETCRVHPGKKKQMPVHIYKYLEVQDT